MSATADNAQPYFPLAGGAGDGWSTDKEATATCFCGAVQLVFVSANHPCGSLAPHVCPISVTDRRLEND